MDAAHGPVMITRYRKPGYVIMTADRYEKLMNLPHQCRSLEGVSVSGGMRH